jgi:hypothetical protein
MKDNNKTSERKAVVVTYTRDAALPSDKERCGISRSAHTFSEIVWADKAAGSIECLTSPYWGNRVIGLRAATAAEVAALIAKEDRQADYMAKATGPQNGSNYRGD